MYREYDNDHKDHNDHNCTPYGSEFLSRFPIYRGEGEKRRSVCLYICTLDINRGDLSKNRGLFWVFSVMFGEDRTGKKSSEEVCYLDGA